MPRKSTTKHIADPEKLIDHVVTQEDLDNNPELAKGGLKIGETIQIPDHPTPEPLAAEPLKPVAAEPIVAIHNFSHNRAITQVIDGKTYDIQAGRVAEFPKSIADRILAEWPNAKVAVDEHVKAPVESWEAKQGDAWKRAQIEHNIDLSKPKDTVGPRRLPVSEPPIPMDENGKPDPSANKFICPTCVAEFPTVKQCRTHQRNEHGT